MSMDVTGADSVATARRADPLHTSLCRMLDIELPIVAFTHCKEVAVAAINAGGFAVLGEAMRSADDIAGDVALVARTRGRSPVRNRPGAAVVGTAEGHPRRVDRRDSRRLTAPTLRISSGATTFPSPPTRWHSDNGVVSTSAWGTSRSTCCWTSGYRSSPPGSAAPTS